MPLGALPLVFYIVSVNASYYKISNSVFLQEKIMDGYEFKKHIDRAAELNPR